MSVRVVYRDVDYQIKKKLININIEKNANSQIMDSSLFRYASRPSKRQATLENKFWRLDGSYDLYDLDEDCDVALFGSSISANDATDNGYKLSEEIILDYKFEEFQNVSEITFTFDHPDYCTDLKIIGYSDAEKTNVVFEETFIPDSSYYNAKLSDKYNVLTISFVFYAMNKPNRFLKLYGVDFGKSYVFESDEIYDISVLKEISLINQQFPYGTSEIAISTKGKDVIEFKKYKPVFIYYNNKIDCTHFVSEYEETNELRMDLSCADSLYLIKGDIDLSVETINPDEFETITYITDIPGEPMVTQYNDIPNDDGQMPEINISANQYTVVGEKMTLKKFLDTLNVDSVVNFSYDESLEQENVDNYNLGIIDAKEAFSKVLFANQLSVRIKENGNIKIYKDKQNQKKEIKKVFASNYSKKTEEKVNTVVYDLGWDSQSGYYESELLTSTSESKRFPENIYKNFTLKKVLAEIVQGEGGNIEYTLRRSYTGSINDVRRYAWNISAKVPTGNTWILKIWYADPLDIDKQIVLNLEDINANNETVVAEVETNPFISNSNATELSDKLSKYYKNNVSISFDTVLEDENEGDWITVPLRNKTYTGRIEKIEYSMKAKKIGTITMRVYEENV